jgi:hypothetical protein
MKVRHPFRWLAVVIVCSWLAVSTASAQSLAPAGSTVQGMHELPPIPGGGPDPFAKYKNDPVALRALREQARLSSQLRQKQLTDATDLLLKLAQDLRTEIAASPNGIPVQNEAERLEQIQKLARVIQEREKAEDQVLADLTKAGMTP